MAADIAAHVIETTRNLAAQSFKPDNAVPKIAAETRLAEDLLFDSLDREELRLHLEIDFGIDIPDAEFAKCTTVGDLIRRCGG